ncbi:phytolongin Phyl1.2-like [Magnolia sinica]|uniref:phytolongin Phyl1.2-like n=1 Tax=Magnolia sinica TaxID=86752 RepID=UPI0026584AC3|nr:phytolongin Phyl1.2-like [Magnolia sinica]
MIPDPNVILYTCISKGTTILADFSSGDRDLETLAPKCLEKAPSFHRIYTHTIRKRIYMFLMEDPFVYFAIVDEDFGKSQGLDFLRRVRDTFVAEIVKDRKIDGSDSLSYGCFNDEFRSVFHRLMRPAEDGDPIGDSDVLLLRKPKKRSSNGDEAASVAGNVENRVDVPADASVSRECSDSPLQKSGGNVCGRQQAGRMWRRHVRIVLLIDFVVCCILFGVWLSICKGFRCVER